MAKANERKTGSICAIMSYQQFTFVKQIGGGFKVKRRQGRQILPSGME